MANGQTTVNNPSQHSFLSYFGRANYTLKDRYFFQGTARVDGSSRFGRNYRYGFFPSLSAGWVISDEPWFESGQLSFLKARTSWAAPETPPCPITPVSARTAPLTTASSTMGSPSSSRSSRPTPTSVGRPAAPWTRASRSACGTTG